MLNTHTLDMYIHIFLNSIRSLSLFYLGFFFFNFFFITLCLTLSIHKNTGGSSKPGDLKTKYLS